MEELVITLKRGEVAELRELLEAWLKEHEADRFCEAKEGFTQNNKERSDRFHRLKIIYDLLGG